MTSPFSTPKVMQRRLKLLLWGDYGSGKTPLALSFPSPCIIDFEAGADFYNTDSKRFKGTDFQVLRQPKNTDEVMEAVTWLSSNEHDFKTLIIDPLSHYYEMIIVKWTETFSRTNRTKAGDRSGEYYQLQPGDWPHIHREMRDFINTLIRLDMNIICTSHSKSKYEKGSMMKYIGETASLSDQAAYMFDTCIHMVKEDNGQRISRTGIVERDRTGHLEEGSLGSLDYPGLEAAFGKAFLEKPCEIMEGDY